MFAAMKNGKIITTGESKNQIKRKLTQMKIRFDKCTILECNENKCPVCGNVLEIDKNQTLNTKNATVTCFFCQNGIKI